MDISALWIEVFCTDSRLLRWLKVFFKTRGIFGHGETPPPKKKHVIYAYYRVLDKKKNNNKTSKQCPDGNRECMRNVPDTKILSSGLLATVTGSGIRQSVGK